MAEELSNLREAWTVLHDRLLRPGQSEANLDHVVIGPGGMFLVDAKNRAGRVIQWEGGLFQHTVQAGDRVSLNLGGELRKVHGMAAYMAVESDMPVTPVLCLAGSQAAEFGDPRMVRGVWVVPVSRLVEWLNAQPYVLDRETAGRVVTRAMTDFPSTTTDPALLAAIGQAVTREKQARRRVPRGTSRGGGSRRRSVNASSPRRRGRRSFASRLMRAIVGLVMMMVSLGLFVTVVPSMLTSMFDSLATVGAPSVGSTPTSTASPGPALTATGKATAKASSKRGPDEGAGRQATTQASRARARPDGLRSRDRCGGRQEFSGRKVQPIAVGTRMCLGRRDWTTRPPSW